MRHLEINGGRVDAGEVTTLWLPPVDQGYADAQIDDYGGRKRRHYPHQPGTILSLSACFSHPAGQLQGTAGFGFWNAPFGDPTVPWPALPQAAWFFYASAPTDLPLAPDGAGRGWFAATLDATTWAAWTMAPFAPLVLFINQFERGLRQVWPRAQHRLGIRFQPLPIDMTAWHDYYLDWGQQGCRFMVDGHTWLHTNCFPRGPLGFVCWLDNQYMIVTARGRVRWGVLPTDTEQSLMIRHLKIYKR